MALGMANISPEIVSCIGEGRSPSVQELVRVADHILLEMQGTRSAFTWGNQHEASVERQQSFRAAHAALSGTG
jgi:hypothetical protein